MVGAENKEQFLAQFERRRSGTQASGPSWLKELREAGMSTFAQLGFPTQKNEDWKYTNLQPLASQRFVSGDGAARGISKTDLLERAFVDADCPRLVFFNGVHAPQFSSVGSLQAGVRVESLAELIKRNDEILSGQLGHYASPKRQALVALNTAFIDDGAVIVIPPGCQLVKPIYLIYASGGVGDSLVSHPRTLVLLGPGSEAKIVESYIALNGAAYFCNAVTELIGEADAIADHYRLQREGEAGFHTGTLEAHLGRGAGLTAHAVSLSGSLVRNDVHVSLDGEGAECVLNGLYLAGGRQHVDNSTAIEHVKPRARSFELYKGILYGAAHGVFNGKIVVHKDAQKSDARQVNKNLLLSEHAVVNTKPQLEIHADDVKCSHGSTIGQLDVDALFYLRSRGLGLDEARSLLSFAFAADVVGRIKIDSLRQKLDDQIVATFRHQ
jgi:Fe-S cluster assembly protein SufD